MSLFTDENQEMLKSYLKYWKKQKTKRCSYYWLNVSLLTISETVEKVELNWCIQSFKVSRTSTVWWRFLTSCSEQMGGCVCVCACVWVYCHGHVSGGWSRWNVWLLTQDTGVSNREVPAVLVMCLQEDYLDFFFETLLSLWARWYPRNATKPQCSDGSSAQQPWAILSVPLLLLFPSSWFQPDLGKMMLQNTFHCLF